MTYVPGEYGSLHCDDGLVDGLLQGQVRHAPVVTVVVRVEEGQDRSHGLCNTHIKSKLIIITVGTVYNM